MRKITLLFAASVLLLPLACKKESLNSVSNNKVVQEDASIRSSSSLLPIGGTKSKLTLHAGWGGQTIDFVNKTKPRVIKILDRTDHENIETIKNLSPNTLVIGRLYEVDQPVDGDPIQRANEWWQQFKDKINASPLVDYWEGYNEIVVPNVQALQWFATFEKERTRLLATAGKKACIGNFSLGTPEVGDWPHFFPAIDEALKYDGILGLHEYGTPMQQWYDYDDDEGWLCGRYRKVYRQHLIPTGRSLPLAITECGVDYGGIGTPIGNQGDGWKSKYSATEYLSQLDWYDNLLMEDDYVLGATIFAVEIPGWESFDLHPIMSELIDRVSPGDVTYNGGGTGTTPLADVIVTDIWTVPAQPKMNETVEVWCKVKNVGQDITQDVVGVGFKINGQQNSGWWNVQSAMAAGISKDFKMDANYTVTTSSFTIEALADDINRFPESNESNNSKSHTIQLSGGSKSYKGGNANLQNFVIEAEDFDHGGEGNAYHDNSAVNHGGAYRDEGVDIENCAEGGYNVGWIDEGEWLTYSDVRGNDGDYTLTVRVAANTPTNRFHVEVNGVNVTGTITFSGTSGWQNWKTVNAGSVKIPSGNNEVKFVAESTGFNVNYLSLDEVIGGSSGTSYEGGNIDVNNFRVEAEDYDVGGADVSYYDNTSINEGHAYRNDGVDVENCAEGGYDVAWIDQGEWMKYSDIKGNGHMYRVTARVAANTPVNAFHLELNGQNITGTKTFNSTNGWQNWVTIDLGSFVVPKGNNTLRFVAETTGFNVNYFQFDAVGSVQVGMDVAQPTN